MMKDEAPILCGDYLRTWETPENEVPITYFEELVETVENWYTDWRALSLHGSKFNNEKMYLRTLLQECRIEEIMKILTNKPLSPEVF